MKILRTAAFVLAAACMCTGAFAVWPEPAGVYAAEMNVFEGMQYEETDGEITLTGYTEDLPEELVIPAEIGGKPVTRIAGYAFRDSDITSVQIPESVREIGNNAFCFCLRLSSISLPEHIEKIGDHVFSMTKWMKNHPFNAEGKFIVEQNILILADSTACQGEVVIPDGIRYIAGGAFRECLKMTEVSIPDSVTGCGDYAFSGCDQLKEMTFPEGITELGEAVLSSCLTLETVSLPKSLCTLGKSAFQMCRHLHTVTFAEETENLKVIPYSAFRSCSELKSVRLPDSVTVIGAYAFCSCDALSDFDLPPHLTELGEYAVNGCWVLEHVTIPETLTSIPECAFAVCDELTEVTVPARVTSIGPQAFWDCKKLQKITILNPACTVFDAQDTICSVMDGKYAGVIAGYEGSEAALYAKKYDCTFESLGAAPAPVCGDLNGDGAVGAEDAQQALCAYVSGLTGNGDGLSDYRRKAADADGDGAVTAADAQYILMYYTAVLSGEDPAWEALIPQTEKTP